MHGPLPLPYIRQAHHVMLAVCLGDEDRSMGLLFQYHDLDGFSNRIYATSLGIPFGLSDR